MILLAGITPPVNSEAEVTNKPKRRWRVTGWAFGTFGVLFGLAGLGGGETSATVRMIVFALLMAPEACRSRPRLAV